MLAPQSHFVQRVQSFKRILCNQLLLDPHVAHGADQLLDVGAQAVKLALDRLQPMLRDDAVDGVTIFHGKPPPLPSVSFPE